MKRRRSFEERMFASQAFSPGGAGRSRLPSAMPAKAVTERSMNRIPVIWSMNPVDVTDLCPVHTVREGGPLGVWLVTAEPASASDISIDVLVNGSVQDSFTLSAGDDGSAGTGDWDLTAVTVNIFDRVTINITEASPDAALAVHTPMA